jgi:hypothetical protein
LGRAMQGANFTSARLEITREQVARRAAGRIEVKAAQRFGMAMRIMTQIPAV